jgi:uncharacterized protein
MLPLHMHQWDNAHMSIDLKARLKDDLTTSIKARDELRSATLRMVLTAITNEEVAGKEAKVLSDEEILTVLAREGKKRRESAVAYTEANRPELAARENAELEVISMYLPEQLTDAELEGIVKAAASEVTGSGATGGAAMGAVMKIVQPQVKGRADGGVVAAMVRAALGN